MKKNKNMKAFSTTTDIRFNLLRCIFVICCCLLIFFTVSKSLLAFELKESEQFNRDLKNYNVKLQILNKRQNIIAQFATAIADDDSKRKIGLMHLDSLPQNHAMLFVFERKEVIYMWMKNTSIALDMLFIGENGIITDIKQNTSPYSLEIISSNEAVIQVLEINAGLSKRLGIEIGDVVKVVE